jgi:NAD(P)H-hydrate epimerase
MKKLDFDFLKNTIKPRPYNAHKGSMGCLFTLCGSYGMAGAEILSSLAALRSGVGLLKSAVVNEVYSILAGIVPEAVYMPMNSNSEGRFSFENFPEILKAANASSSALVGCGLGVCNDTENLVTNLITQSKVPLVLDADGINCISKHINLLKEKSCPVIVTPHPKEMSRLTNLSVKDILNNREETAENFSREYNVVTVLKGADTIVTDGKDTFISYAGNAGMATGGSGDVLAGIIASFLAQGYSPIESACIGVFAHGTAGDFAKEDLTEISMLPSDLINYLPKVFKKII